MSSSVKGTSALHWVVAIVARRGTDGAGGRCGGVGPARDGGCSANGAESASDTRKSSVRHGAAVAFVEVWQLRWYK